MDTIKVLFLAAEADPLVKVGGLGDIAGSLPRALKQLIPEETGGPAVDIRLVIPFHEVIRKKIDPPELLFDFQVPAREGPVKAQAFYLRLNGVHTYLISGGLIGKDAAVYSTDPVVDGYKYAFFSLAALELAKKLGWQPDILHANDWHTALAVYALKLKQPIDPFYKDTRSVLSIHNLPFMGAGTEAAFDAFCLPASQYPRIPWWGRKFPLPLGLQTADRIAAVSPSYAQEIMTAEYGCGLENLIKARRKVVSGIVNGLDMESWNPEKDPAIPVNFTAATPARRQRNKAALLEEFSLNPDPRLPLLILISRMDQQKGVDLAIAGLEQLAGGEWQAILLGTGDPQLEEAARLLEERCPDRIRAVIRFDAGLSRRMYAGADILLMPSRYEPCGLAQMMAMRYGCVPLARATGGLRDTITDATESAENGTGFLFQPATVEAFIETLRRALTAYQDHESWAKLQKHGMSQDFSWAKSAGHYVELYRELVK